MHAPLPMSFLLALVIGVASTSATLAASLTRIETRPFYGATVTIEEGVRVFRPLPPHRHVIINPEGKTPLNLTFEERNIVVHHTHNLVESGDDGAARFGFGGRFGYRLQSRSRYAARPGRGHIIRVPRNNAAGLGGR